MAHDQTQSLFLLSRSNTRNNPMTNISCTNMLECKRKCRPFIMYIMGTPDFILKIRDFIISSSMSVQSSANPTLDAHWMYILYARNKRGETKYICGVYNGILYLGSSASIEEVPRVVHHKCLYASPLRCLSHQLSSRKGNYLTASKVTTLKSS